MTMANWPAMLAKHGIENPDQAWLTFLAQPNIKEIMDALMRNGESYERWILAVQEAVLRSKQ